MKVLVSDMGGVLYSFHPSFNPQNHEKAFDAAITDMGKAGSDLWGQLQAERDAIKSGGLIVYPNKVGVSHFLHNLALYHGVIVATSLVDTTEYILEKLGIGSGDLDIFDISVFGSKKDVGAWSKIFGKLSALDVIVEDNERNLAAAREAAQKLNFAPKTYTAMPLLSS